MNRLFCFLLMFVAAMGTVGAQNPNDSIRFAETRRWRVLDRDPRLEVKSFKSKPNDTASYLFGSPQAIYVVELAPDRFRTACVQEPKRQKVGRLVARNKALLGFNGGFFVVRPTPPDAAVAEDFVKSNGQIVGRQLRAVGSVGNRGAAAVAFDEQGGVHFGCWNGVPSTDSLVVWAANRPNAMVAGPMLIHQGEPCALGADQRHPRTAIGVKADGTVVVLVVDGRSKRASGASFAELAALGRWLGVEHLLNLDGGGSSTLVYKGRLINTPSDGGGVIPLQRKVANGVLVFVK